MQGILRLLGGLLGFFLAIELMKRGSYPILPLLVIINAYVLVNFVVVQDEKCKMDSLYCSLPLKRSTVIKAKYLSTAITITIGIILAILTSATPDQVYFTLHSNLKFIFWAFYLSFMFFCIVFPLIYGFGYYLEMGLKRGLLILVVLAPVLGGVTYGIFKSGLLLLPFKNTFPLLVLILGISIFISLKLSITFYNQKEF